jgi:hypothetical protein
MEQVRLFIAIGILSCVSPLVQPGAADTYQMILKGKVMMKDGSPPPGTAGIQRECSDSAGSAPGPLTDKKGQFLWRMDVDNMLTRTCTLYASIAGYDSTRIDISNLSGMVNNIKELPPMILTRSAGDPRVVKNTDEDGRCEQFRGNGCPSPRSGCSGAEVFKGMAHPRDRR